MYALLLVYLLLLFFPLALIPFSSTDISIRVFRNPLLRFFEGISIDNRLPPSFGIGCAVEEDVVVVVVVVPVVDAAAAAIRC